MLNIFKLNLKDKKQSSIKIDRGNLVSKTRHYPPDVREWFNSVYAFNKNTTKLLPVADTVIIKLIRSYFKLYSAKLDKETKSWVIRNKEAKLTTNRIFVSKAEVRHTSDKVLITVYLYNKEKEYYLNKIRSLYFLRFKLVNLKYLVETIKINLIRLINLKNKINLSDSEPLQELKGSRYFLSLKRQINLKNKKLIAVESLKKKRIFFNIRETIISSMKLIKPKALSIIPAIKKKKRVSLFLKKKNIKTRWDVNKFKDHDRKFIKNFTLKHLEKGLLYLYYKQSLFLNKSKFNYNYVLPLKSLIEKVYNKKVEFNLVTLKYFHLNSDIFTQILTLKARGRKNSIIKVLKASLRAVYIPYANKSLLLQEVYNRKMRLQVLNVKDLLSKPLFVNKDSNSDKLNNILEKYLPLSLNIEFIKYLNMIVLTNFLPFKLRTEFEKFLKHPKSNAYLSPMIKKEYDQFCKNTVLSGLKYKKINGIRIEAAGRLSRRFIAARSVFKLRYIGNLKNIDSSIRGFSSVLLRGHFRSNLQLTKLSSKRRIGAFGLKTWINSD